MNRKLLLIGFSVVLATGVFLVGRMVWRVQKHLVTLKVRNMPLADVVKRIERLAGSRIKADPKLDARITLDVRDMQLAKVLDLVAEQAGARWAATHAVFHSKNALGRLEPLLVTAAKDSDLDSAGWTNLAPHFSTPPPRDHDGLVLRGAGPIVTSGDEGGGSNGPLVLHTGSMPLQNSEDINRVVDDLVKQGAAVKQSDDGAVRTVTLDGQGASGGRRVVVMNSGGKMIRKEGGLAEFGGACHAITVRRMVGPGGVTTTTTDGGGAVQILKSTADGKLVQEDIWAPERLVMESSLTAKLGDAIPKTANLETAAETARKVQGQWVTYYALDRSPVAIDPSMSRLLRSGLHGLDARGTNGPLAESDVRGLIENEARQRKLEGLSKTPEEQVQRARLKQAAQSGN